MALSYWSKICRASEIGRVMVSDASRFKQAGGSSGQLLCSDSERCDDIVNCQRRKLLADLTKRNWICLKRFVSIAYFMGDDSLSINGIKIRYVGVLVYSFKSYRVRLQFELISFS